MSLKFQKDIAKFNSMYGLPSSNVPTTELEPLAERMKKFKVVILDEISEVDDIIENAGKDELTDLVNLSDWLCDIIVYCTSEALRFGIPVEEVLAIIMRSNFSKLGADGKAIISGGKVQKGPGYYKPEPEIKKLLAALRGEANVQ